MHTAYLALGSNLGDRQANLNLAIKLLNNKSTQVTKISSFLANPPIEAAGPHEFLNAVVEITTELSSYKLLDFIQQIEREIDLERDARGRKRARVIDIDILLYDKLTLDDARLTIPHPRMLNREFVMTPLKEIYPGYQT
jgi:2-amino-4-hydroxy-6-hydroxymethyldihydropteridine diphosphokinase